MARRVVAALFWTSLLFLSWLILGAYRDADTPDDLLHVDDTNNRPSASQAAANNPLPSAISETNPKPRLGMNDDAAAQHQQHAQTAQPAPMPALFARRQVDPRQPLDHDGLGRAIVDWDILAGTHLPKNFSPQFPAHLHAVDGKTITLTGFMSPLDEIGTMNSFLLLEFPLGCFYCLTPPPTGIVVVELAEQRRVPLHYERVQIAGLLRLNRDDPEDFLYILTQAELSLAE